MNWTEQINSRPRQWRQFGWTIGPVLIGLGLWLGWRSHPVALVCCGSAGLALLLLAWTAPSLLRWPYLIWMTAGLLLGTVVSTVFLAVFFLLVVSPFAFVARLLRKDFLEQRLDPRRCSYWKRRDATDPPPPSRYEQQF